MTDIEQPESNPESFTSIEETQSRNRGSQLLLILAALVTVLGGIFAIAGQWWGLVLLGGGFAALIGLTAWSIRNWDWER